MKIIFLNLFLLPCILSLHEDLLNFVNDDVQGGSYKYYNLMSKGIIKIQLISQTGDADLYVSNTITTPTYEPDRHSLQSTTCGEDIIIVPDSFRRPVIIGVYGHPVHELSEYTLLIYEVIPRDEDITYENIYKDSDNKKKSPTFLVSLLRSIWDALFNLYI